ncbi:CYFA0S04e01310g1_1 [Cyberlindnera fabianii]|uniref:rRNA methyltransferase 2, mitochondrial n=1 Tax=Cyberlindnera fabianii TaxID=36022 RepID=A0A061AZ58_CYBFA|nr:CYFA0S04e01310g1_1 [Cyberlindnera fabianii]
MEVLVRREPVINSVFWLSVRCYSSKRSASSNNWINRQLNDKYTREAKFENYKSRAAYKLQSIDDKFKLLRPGQKVVDLGFAPGAWTQVAVERTSPNGAVLGVDIIPARPPPGASALQANILSKQTHVMIQKHFMEHKATEQEDDIITESYIAKEMADGISKDVESNSQLEEELSTAEKLPVDVILSDMYAPIIPPYRHWNNTTNSAYNRMLNTSGVAIKDHAGSIDLCDAALILAIDILKPGGAFTCKFYTGKEDKGLEKRLQRVFNRVVRFKPEACRPESKECYFVALGKKKNVDKMAVFS